MMSCWISVSLLLSPIIVENGSNTTPLFKDKYSKLFREKVGVDTYHGSISISPLKKKQTEKYENCLMCLLFVS